MSNAKKSSQLSDLEGQWFAVPLAGGHAVGLVSRAPRRGSSLLGHFFGPLRPTLPRPEELNGLRPQDALLVARFEKDAILSGRWAAIGSVSRWNREDWPLPEFRMVDSYRLTGKSWVVKYSERNLDRFAGQREVPSEQESEFPPNEGIFPAEHLEAYLAELLDTAAREEPRAPLPVEEGVTYYLLVPLNRAETARRELQAMGLRDITTAPDDERGVFVGAFQGGSVDALHGEVDRMEQQLTALAESVGGVYDGLEWSLPTSEPLA